MDMAFSFHFAELAWRGIPAPPIGTRITRRSSLFKQ
jgi:hypothetical protein